MSEPIIRIVIRKISDKPHAITQRVFQSREIILEDYATGNEVVKIFKGFGEWQDVQIVNEETGEVIK